MNIQPAQQVPADIPQPDQSLCRCHDTPDCPEQATVEINANQLAHIAELLDLLDGFLRHANTIGDRLADYLRATGRDHPQPPHWASYDANLLIDQVSFTAHNLRAHRHPEPLQLPQPSGGEFQ
ncbi:MAG TPA: hypothetical protein VLZ05_09865 [Mycobacterium sp.]|nr:hypothetical protein [Mycobacterium sp.]HUH69147.1 hypothetical protein [Mycobacterium sp.]